MLSLVNIAVTALALSPTLVSVSRAADVPAWCNTDLLRDSSNSRLETRYRVRSAGAYCEGVASQLKAGTLEFVGFHSGTIAPAVGAGVTVALSPTVRGYTKDKGGIYLLGADWSGTYNYRLDGSLQVADLQIDAKQVLAPLKIDPSKLGFLAWLERSPRHEYLPVELGTNARSLVVIAVSAVPLRLVRATLIDPRTEKTLQQDFAQQNVPARTPITIAIEFGTTSTSAVMNVVGWDSYQDDPVDVLALNLFIPQR